MTPALATLRPLPLSHREQDFHREAIRSGWITSEFRFVGGRRQVVTWNRARDAFSIDALTTEDGFEIADQIAGEKRYEIELLARRHHPRGVTFQYLVIGWSSDHGSAA